MDGIANVAKQQQTQMSSAESQGRAVEQITKVATQATQVNIVKEIQQQSVDSSKKINSAKDVKNLVKDLNKALLPMNTNLKFGVDSHDVFFVSVIESQTNKIIRRFPAEQAKDFLPKMQEVTGILFDSKG